MMVVPATPDRLLRVREDAAAEMSSEAPETDSETDDADARAPAPERARVPAFTVTVPEIAFAASRLVVPAPDLTRGRLPPMEPPKPCEVEVLSVSVPLETVATPV